MRRGAGRSAPVHEGGVQIPRRQNSACLSASTKGECPPACMEGYEGLEERLVEALEAGSLTLWFSLACFCSSR